MMNEEHWHRMYGLEKVLLTSYEKQLAVGMMFPSLLSTFHGLALSVYCLDHASNDWFSILCEDRDLSLWQRVQTGSRTHSATVWGHWKTLFSRVKQRECEAIHSRPSCTKITVRGSKPHSVMHLHCVVLNYVKNNFALCLFFGELARHKCKQIIIIIITITIVRTYYSLRCDRYCWRFRRSYCLSLQISRVTLKPRWWRHLVSLKCWYLSTKLRSVTAIKIIFLIFTAI